MRDYYAGVLAKLISARLEAGLTQREVSLRLGMAHSFMNKCESGERAIDVAELWVLSGIRQTTELLCPGALTATGTPMLPGTFIATVTPQPKSLSHCAPDG